MCPIRFLSFLAILALTTNAPTYAQYQGATEWSTQIWVAASDGHWDTVTTLLNNVPEGEEVDLQTFKSQLKIYYDEFAQAISLSR